MGIQRLDMIVDNKIAVETKSTLELHKAATRQLFNYLKATTLEVGFLFHFGPEAHFYRVVCQRNFPERPDIRAGNNALSKLKFDASA